MILFIASIISKIFGIDLQKAQLWALGLVGLVILILAAVIFNYCSSCADRRAEKEKDRINANLANLAANEKGVETEANQATNQAENANREAENARNQPVNGKDNSYSNARERYCKEFPRDCK